MNIGFDAKRAFHNSTGLGHYSRTLINSLARYFPEHHYYLFNPRTSDRFPIEFSNLVEKLPSTFIDRLLPSAWRSSGVKKDLLRNQIDLYHGLSHEIPMGIGKTGIKTCVTIHDLIHERYPEQYKAIDVRIYQKKFRYACEHANRIIAISEQTKSDITEFYKTPAEKIDVCYQSCNPAFNIQKSAEEKEMIRVKYALPKEFFLYVGSIIERKNLLNICKAIFLLRNELDVPLVVIGSGGKYKLQVQDYIRQNNLEDKIIFLSDSAAAASPGFQSASDFPAIYQSAIAMIYPSFFEGFGIPVLEALASRLPVITSNVSCLPEAGGDAAFYVNPANAAEIAAAMQTIYPRGAMVQGYVDRGVAQAKRFSPENCATAVMKVYQSI
jgi:glycosyltransferase involved in cell wall biosynthesis